MDDDEVVKLFRGLDGLPGEAEKAGVFGIALVVGGWATLP